MVGKEDKKKPGVCVRGINTLEQWLSNIIHCSVCEMVRLYIYDDKVDSK